MLVSIIVPIYNGFKYINKLYISLINQTFQDFEVWFINDGSYDNSLEILTKIIKKDERINVCNQKNKGICAARNAGIAHARGKYIIFLDQDDSFENNLIESYVSAIETQNVDMASFGKIHYWISDEVIVKKEFQKFNDERVSNLTKMYEYLFNIDNKKRLMTIWNCIYRKDVIEKYNIQFDEHFKHGDEDGMFNIEYVLHCKSIYFSSKCCYHYYIRKGVSTITKYNDELLNDYLYFIDKLYYLVSKIKDEYINALIKLYMLRFFSNIYIRFCRHHPKTNDKINFLKRLRNSKNFEYALTFSNKKYYKHFSIKYFYWNIINFFLIKKKYIISILLLNIIKSLKSLDRK